MDEALRVRFTAAPAVLAVSPRVIADDGRVRAFAHSAFLDFEIWDMPGGMYELDRLPNFDIQKLGSVIFVIDAQVRAGSPLTLERRAD